jgi:CheY-like chemotaxis protein
MPDSRPAGTLPVVAVINTSDDLVQVLREALIREGFDVVTSHVQDFKTGRQNFGSFLRSHKPAVVVYDISVPYEDNWTFLQMLRELPDARGQAFVITTVNKRIFERRVGPADVIEIEGGRADDIDPVIDAVRRQVSARQ